MSFTPPPGDGPTVVLVHGAFTDSSLWSGVIAELLEEGHPVIAAANPLRGVRHDADHLRRVLDAIDGDVLLVGHSYGGTVITNAATGDERVKALVYVSGFAPEAGETTAELAARKGGRPVDDSLTAVALLDGSSDLYVPPDLYRARLAADCPARDVLLMALTQRPLAAAALDEPSGEPAWRTIPSWFLYGDEDRVVHHSVHRFMAERAGAQLTVELAGAAHTLAVSEAPAVVEVIHEAIAAVTT